MIWQTNLWNGAIEHHSVSLSISDLTQPSPPHRDRRLTLTRKVSCQTNLRKGSMEHHRVGHRIGTIFARQSKGFALPWSQLGLRWVALPSVSDLTCLVGRRNQRQGLPVSGLFCVHALSLQYAFLYRKLLGKSYHRLTSEHCFKFQSLGRTLLVSPN